MNLQEVLQWYDFSDKNVVITGGTGVLGGEMACALVGCGANVAVLDRNPDLPEYLKQPMDAGPGKYMVAFADVLVREKLELAARQFRAHSEMPTYWLMPPAATTPGRPPALIFLFLIYPMKRCASFST